MLMFFVLSMLLISQSVITRSVLCAEETLEKETSSGKDRAYEFLKEKMQRIEFAYKSMHMGKCDKILKRRDIDLQIQDRKIVPIVRDAIKLVSDRVKDKLSRMRDNLLVYREIRNSIYSTKKSRQSNINNSFVKVGTEENALIFSEDEIYQIACDAGPRIWNFDTDKTNLLNLMIEVYTAAYDAIYSHDGSRRDTEIFDETTDQYIREAMDRETIYYIVYDKLSRVIDEPTASEVKARRRKLGKRNLYDISVARLRPRFSSISQKTLLEIKKRLEELKNKDSLSFESVKKELDGIIEINDDSVLERISLDLIDYNKKVDGDFPAIIQNKEDLIIIWKDHGVDFLPDQWVEMTLLNEKISSAFQDMINEGIAVYKKLLESGWYVSSDAIKPVIEGLIEKFRRSDYTIAYAIILYALAQGHNDISNVNKVIFAIRAIIGGVLKFADSKSPSLDEIYARAIDAEEIYNYTLLQGSKEKMERVLEEIRDLERKLIDSDITDKDAIYDHLYLAIQEKAKTLGLSLEHHIYVKGSQQIRDNKYIRIGSFSSELLKDSEREDERILLLTSTKNAAMRVRPTIAGMSSSLRSWLVNHYMKKLWEKWRSNGGSIKLVEPEKPRKPTFRLNFPINILNPNLYRR